MPIFLNRVEKYNPLKKVKNWHLTLKTVKLVTEKEVAQQIADETTLNPKEAEMAIHQLQKVLVNNLLQGNSIRLGDWGTFHLTCNSVAADTKEALTANNMKGLNIRFQPAKSVKEAIGKAQFMFVESLMAKESSSKNEKRN
jgi:predicted histone-like DNA-binding protein